MNKPSQTHHKSHLQCLNPYPPKHPVATTNKIIYTSTIRTHLTQQRTVPLNQYPTFDTHDRKQQYSYILTPFLTHHHHLPPTPSTLHPHPIPVTLHHHYLPTPHHSLPITHPNLPHPTSSPTIPFQHQTNPPTQTHRSNKLLPLNINHQPKHTSVYNSTNNSWNTT